MDMSFANQALCSPIAATLAKDVYTVPQEIDRQVACLNSYAEGTA